MNTTLIHSAAWAAAWATAIWQRILLPALLLAFTPETHQSQLKTQPRIYLVPSLAPSPSPDLERMTCAQLRELAGTRRKLSKRELIARIRSSAA
jgi:hypothetical protein